MNVMICKNALRMMILAKYRYLVWAIIEGRDVITRQRDVDVLFHYWWTDL